MAHLLPKPLQRRRLTTARMFGQTRGKRVLDGQDLDRRRSDFRPRATAAADDRYKQRNNHTNNEQRLEVGVGHTDYVSGRRRRQQSGDAFGVVSVGGDAEFTHWMAASPAVDSALPPTLTGGIPSIWVARESL